MRRNIPFVKFGGLKFLEAAHVKDLLAVLRLRREPARPDGGVPGAAAPARRRAGGGRGDARGDRGGGEPRSRAPKRAAADWPALARTSCGCSGAATPGWPAEIEAARLWYEPHLERLHEDAAVRRGDLAQLCRIAAGFASRQAFLTELTLDPPQATSDLAGAPHRDEDYLVLSTIHSAKGQEWSRSSC